MISCRLSNRKINLFEIKLLAVTSNGCATFLGTGIYGASTTSCWASDAIISSADITASRLNFYLVTNTAQLNYIKRTQDHQKKCTHSSVAFLSRLFISLPYCCCDPTFAFRCRRSSMVRLAPVTTPGSDWPGKMESPTKNMLSNRVRGPRTLKSEV